MPAFYNTGSQSRINRLQKVLESANIKLAGVATDILGVSGRQMLTALANGEGDPAALADRARGQLRKKLEALGRALQGRALQGRVRPHHRVLIPAIVQHVTFLERSRAELDAEVDHARAPFASEMALLQQLPGVNRTAAATISAEIGGDMGRFASAAHLASWAGGCPGNRQSGGKRLRSPITTGNPWLRGLVGEVAWAAVRCCAPEGHRVRRAVPSSGTASEHPEGARSRHAPPPHCHVPHVAGPRSLP